MRHRIIDQTTSNRKDQFNNGIKLIVDFYKEPLVTSLKEHQKAGKSLQWISKNIFKGELSRQAIHQNYLGDKE